MAFYDRYLDRAIARLGYIKARDMTIAPVFAGEAPLQIPIWNDQADEAREKLAVTSSWVYSDIRTIANTATSAEAQVVRKGEEVEGHPFVSLLAHPNAHMTGAWMLQYTVWWLLLRGEAYWLKLINGAGELVELWPIPSARMAPIPDAQKYIAGYSYQPTNGQPPVTFLPEQVVFFRFPNPFDYHRGLSPLSAYRLAVETDIAASLWNKRTFEDDVTLRTLISLPQTMGKAAFDMAKGEILNELLERQRRFMIARAGDVSATNLSMSPKDLEFLQGREFTREEIDRVFGIPSGFWAKEATRANSDAAKLVMIEQAVWPLLVLVGDQLTVQVVHPVYGDDQDFQYEDIRSEDRELLVKEREVYWQVQTVDEAREELGLAPLEDEELGAKLVTQVKAGSGGGAPPPDADTEPAHQLPPPPELADVEDTPDMRADMKRWESVARRRLKDGKSAAYDFESDAIPADVHASVLAALESAGTVDEIKAAFEVKARRKPAPRREPNREMENALRKRIETILSTNGQHWVDDVRAGRNPDLTDTMAALRAELTTTLASAATEEALAQGVDHRIDFDTVEINTAALEWARKYSYELVKDIEARTRKLIANAVETFTTTPGMTNEQLIQMLRVGYNPDRAGKIAITEVTRAYAQGTTIYQEMLAGAGIKMARVWNTSADDTVCDICGPNEGKTEGNWTVPEGPPGHVNCRCWTTLEYQQ